MSIILSDGLENSTEFELTIEIVEPDSGSSHVLVSATVSFCVTHTLSVISTKLSKIQEIFLFI